MYVYIICANLSSINLTTADGVRHTADDRPAANRSRQHPSHHIFTHYIIIIIMIIIITFTNILRNIVTTMIAIL